MLKNQLENATSVQVLTKTSTQNEVETYFKKVCELKQSNDEFPVSLDEVWMLVYGRKDEAVRSLTSTFIQDVDYQSLRKNAERKGGGQNEIDYKLSVSCLEYFIARKVRPVFEVYRKVFHKAVEQTQLDFSNPETVLKLAQNWAAEQQLRIEAEKKIEEQRPAVVFHESVTASNTVISVADMAKLICQNGVDMGEQRLYKWFVENKYLICRQRWSKTKNRYENDYMPYQRYIEQGLFFVTETVIQGSEKPFVKHTIKITGKGQTYFIDKFLTAKAA